VEKLTLEANAAASMAASDTLTNLFLTPNGGTVSFM
jgi:hypothetical protein